MNNDDQLASIILESLPNLCVTEKSTTVPPLYDYKKAIKLQLEKFDK